MLVSFRVPHDEEFVGRCFLSFFHQLGYSRGAAGIRGQGQMYAYKLREEIFIGKTTYHGRPRRESGGIVFGISVWFSFSYCGAFFVSMLMYVFFRFRWKVVMRMFPGRGFNAPLGRLLLLKLCRIGRLGWWMFVGIVSPRSLRFCRGLWRMG